MPSDPRRRVEGDNPRARVGLVLGPLAALAMLAAPAPSALGDAGWHTAAVGVLMAIWWVSEAIPIPATALVPLVLFPLLDVGTIAEAAGPFANPVIYLLFGGFVLAIGLESSGLHRRVALSIIRLVGTRPRRLVAGFMLATAATSLCVSNTATTAMMLPMAVSVLALIEPDDDRHAHLAPALLIGIAYAANIGGMGTLVGTAPNALLAGYLNESAGYELTFLAWLGIGLPVVVVAVPLVWFVLVRRLHPLGVDEIEGSREAIEAAVSELGATSRRERVAGAITVVVALLWVTRPLLTGWLPGLSDAGIAMAGALALFAVPVGWRPFRATIEWNDMRRMPWGLLVLFGGGLSLAAAIQRTGLARWLGDLLSGLSGVPTIVVVVIITTLVVFLTEIASNTATTAAFLPVAGSLAVAIDADLLVVAVPVALAASCAFMMPVATPPNAIVYGSGRLTIPQMARAGFWINLLMIGLVTLAARVLVPWLS